MVDLQRMTQHDIEKKIDSIKKAQQQQQEALKRYEAELENRKKIVPLGIPSSGNWCVNIAGVATPSLFNEQDMWKSFNCFPNESSAQRHSEMMVDWRQGLVNAALGNRIDINVIKPFLRHGYVAMDSFCSWIWFSESPQLLLKGGCWYMDNPKAEWYSLDMYKIKPADDWMTSIKEVGL